MDLIKKNLLYIIVYAIVIYGYVINFSKLDFWGKLIFGIISIGSFILFVIHTYIEYKAKQKKLEEQSNPNNFLK